MKTVGIIAEFNPFHKGHEYIIREAKRITGADYCIIIMSGSFVQRGAPAIMPKHTRAACSLYSGADLVLELPVSYATASAEAFAYGAVSILNALGVVDYLVFGSECGNIEILNQIAKSLLNPTDEYLAILNTGLKEGLSYPAARMKALSGYENILSSPNNILGIEYIKSLHMLNSSITPLTIKRLGNSYDSKDLSDSFSSASAIRLAIEEATLNAKDLSYIYDQFPESIYRLMAEGYKKAWPISINDLSQALHLCLLLGQNFGFADIQDSNEDISNRICKKISEYESITDFVNVLKTKDLTYSRLLRVLLHITLGMKDMTRDSNGQLIECPYTHILGFRKSASELMHSIKVNTTIPMVNKPADASKIMSLEALEYYKLEEKTDNIYNMLIKNKYGTHQKSGCQISPIII